ncbi:MAG TPA: signal peptidase I [Candidatus Faecimonas gallistercoris]|nr:signal peptidase I [Candidatus Faecimonas gallistercoris]
MKQYFDTNHDDVVSAMEVVQFFLHFFAKVVLYVIFILLVIIFLLFIFYFIDLLYNLHSGEDKPPLFDAYVIVSPSMVPTINVEDAIIIRRTNPKELKQGDIISYLATDSYYKGKIITHRIISIEEAEDGTLLYRTKGDNNNVADGTLVSEDNIYGKVLFRIPMLGYIRRFLFTYFGWILCIVLPFLYLILSEVVRVRKMIKKEKNTEKDSIEVI